MTDITERLRKHELGPDEWLSDLLKEGATEIERLREALQHCVNAIAEYARDNDESIRPFLLGSLDNARKTLSFANLNKNLYPEQIDNGDTDE